MHACMHGALLGDGLQGVSCRRGRCNRVASDTPAHITYPWQPTPIDGMSARLRTVDHDADGSIRLAIHKIATSCHP